MVLTLDPKWPLVWRSPHSLQLGVDRPIVVLDPVNSVEERLIAALVLGVARSGLDMIAATPEDVDTLLDRLSGAMLTDGRPSPGVRVHGEGPTAEHLRSLLPDAGAPVVIVAHHVIAPELHGHWLRRDIPHLPVVYGDGVVRIGPLIEPGSGPCLYCLELHRTDADPAWPVIASQLLGRPAATETALLAAEVAAIVVRLLAAGDPATSMELEVATGSRSTRVWVRHPDCQCGAVTAARPGSVTEHDPRPAPIRISPRRVATAGEPA